MYYLKGQHSILGGRRGQLSHDPVRHFAIEADTMMSLGGIANLDYAVILCSKMNEPRAFYKNIMGFAVAEDTENWVSFRVGSTLLTLRPRGPWSVCDDGAWLSGSAAVQLAFRVSLEAIDQCHEELVAKGVPILREPTDLPKWRHRTLFLRDPEDNIIELYAEF